MSAVKPLVAASLMVIIAVHSTRAGSIHLAHHQATGRDSSTPTTLVFADTPATSHRVAAENLANPSNSPNFWNWTAYQAVPEPATTTALTLGMTGGNLAPNANVPTVSSGSTPAWTPPIAPQPIAQSTPDAFINFGNGPYSEAGSLTTGHPQAFLNSPIFTHLFGSNGPSSADISHFEGEVLSTIQTTYNNAGLAINLTTDPNAQAAHTMSVVSGASYTGTPGAIGITDVGNNGFSFIDKFAGVQNADQLAIAIGHNLSHELMHAFGIANHPEQTGPYVDAATSTLQALTDPNTGFSPAAASLLSTLNFQAVGQSVTAGAQKIDGDQILVASPVPEPSTIAVWSMAGGLWLAARRRRRVARTV